jgi:dipeptide/tripeptide permease
MHAPRQSDIESVPLVVHSARNMGITYGALSPKIGSRKATAFGVPLVCATILIVELCERLAFYTFTGTQEFFLEKLGYSVAASGGINATMGTLCTAWAFLAGWVADVWLGRYHTILAFGSIYAAGAVMAMAAAWPAHTSSRLYLAGIMGLVPIGTAGIKANISNFGADQYDANDPEQLAAREKFFSWFYLAINLGSAVAYGGLTTVAASGGVGIPKQYGYFAVYAFAALVMQAAVMIFRSNRASYRVQATQSRSSLGGVSAQVMAAAKKGSFSATAVCTGVILMLAGLVLSVVQALIPDMVSLTNALGVVAFFCSAVGITAVTVCCLKPDWVMVEARSDALLAPSDVRDYLRLLPVLLTANLAFSALYNSMQYWYQQQACQMDVRMPWATSDPLGQQQFAGSFFMIADCLGIVIATPIALGWVNPGLDKLKGSPLGHGAKYSIGMLFGALSVVMAAYIERMRREMPLLPFLSNCAPQGIHMSGMSASWMFVPFFLMGLGEIYTSPVLMNLAYTQSPPSMRTLTSATGLVIGGVSTSLFALQINALAPYVPNDLNHGHLELGYFSNIVIAGFFLMAYLVCLRWFEEKTYDN